MAEDRTPRSVGPSELTGESFAPAPHHRRKREHAEGTQQKRPGRRPIVVAHVEIEEGRHNRPLS